MSIVKGTFLTRTTIAVIVFGALTLGFVANFGDSPEATNANIEPAPAIEQTPTGPLPLTGNSTLDNSTPQIPVEIVQSIYDYDRDFVEKAQTAAENMVALYNPESYVRWRSIVIDPKSILNGSRLETGSMPNVISISPFPDLTFVANQTKFEIMDNIQSSVWIGSINGDPTGTVRISIVGEVDNPVFIMKIVQGELSIAITDVVGHSSYVAIEGNPHRKPWIN